jgi:hypothetical protein
MTTMFGPVSKRFLFGITIILLLTLAASSVLYRLSKAKPLLKPDFLDSRFNTSWRSGRSDRNILARLTEVKSLLWIIATRDHLQVSDIPALMKALADIFADSDLTLA